MPTMDIFQQDAFSTMSLTTAVETMPYVPQRIGELGLFADNPVSTRDIAIEERNGTLALIQTSELGAPPEQQVPDKRKIRSLRTRRLFRADTIQAAEIQNIRAWGSETDLETVQNVVAQRLLKLRRAMELTHEYHRMGALQGKLLDADGSPIYNFFTEFGIAEPDEIDFDLDAASPAPGDLQSKCQQVVETMEAALESGWVPGTEIRALCGSAFWRNLTSHPEIRELWIYAQQVAAQAAALRGINTVDEITYGGITFERYRGNTAGTVGIHTDKCRFFPRGVPDLFEVAWSPLESMDAVNTIGRPTYAMLLPDPSGRNFYVSAELYSYPVHYCTRPATLLRARRT